MWLVSCRRHGMLTQKPLPDPKCKLIISSFLALPNLLDWLYCIWNAMSIVFSLQMMGEWDRWVGGWFILGCGWGNRGWVSSYSFWFFLTLLYFVVSRSQTLYLVCFFVFSLFSLSPIPLTGQCRIQSIFEDTVY